MKSETYLPSKPVLTFGLLAALSSFTLSPLSAQDYDSAKERIREQTRRNAEAAEAERFKAEAERERRREEARAKAEARRAWEEEASHDLVPVSDPTPRTSPPVEYPSRALREGLEGRTSIIVTVEANGRPSKCIVTESSGHSVLDDAACSLGMRTQFNPALNSYGFAIRGEWAHSINWQQN